MATSAVGAAEALDGLTIAVNVPAAATAKSLACREEKVRVIWLIQRWLAFVVHFAIKAFTVGEFGGVI